MAWPAQWRNYEWFAVVLSTAGLFLVDIDAAYDVEDDKLVERKPTQAEAEELAKALGGHGLIYESTKGASKWHILFGDAGNGGRDWTERAKAGYASQGGLLWKTADGAYLQFDTRGGGVYTDGKSKGEICGARMDANARRLGKLHRALDIGVTPLSNVAVLDDAYDLRKAMRQRYGTTLTGVHEHVIEETNRIAKLPKPARAAARKRLVDEAASVRAQRNGAAALDDCIADADAEVDRALAGAVEHVTRGASSQFRFADVFELRADGNWRFVVNTKTWWHWDGKHWTEQTSLAHMRMKDVIADDTGDDVQEIAKWQNNQHVAGALTIAGHALSIQPDAFNANPLVAGLPNGRMLDLETGEVRAALRDDYCTMTLTVEPQPGEPEALLAFLRYAFAKYEDECEDLIDALLWTCGDALRGRVNVSDSHGFVYYQGLPRTGKSTLTNVMHRVMGDYATTINASRITGNREEHLQWLMRLRGKRFVAVAELPPKPLKCEIVNALSAGDPIEANAMRQNSIDFRSVAHLVMNGNHRPSINSPGTFRRMRLIEMNRQPATEDDGLEDRIVEHDGGKFLRLALEARNARRRPQWPASVKAAVAQYELENDPVGQWIADECQAVQGEHMDTGDGYASYGRWCEKNGFKANTKTYLSRKMKERGHPSEPSYASGAVSRAYQNIALRYTSTSPDNLGDCF